MFMKLLRAGFLREWFVWRLCLPRWLMTGLLPCRIGPKWSNWSCILPLHYLATLEKQSIWTSWTRIEVCPFCYLFCFEALWMTDFSDKHQIKRWFADTKTAYLLFWNYCAGRDILFKNLYYSNWKPKQLSQWVRSSEIQICILPENQMNALIHDHTWMSAITITITSISLWNLVSRHIFWRCLDTQNFSSLSFVLSKLLNF